MSLSEEKKMILKMLEEGKINGDEAIKLLEALESGTRQNGAENTAKQQKAYDYHEEIFKLREKIGDWRKEFKNSYSHKDFDRMVDDFVAKAEKVGKNVAATTFGIVDKMVDFVASFVDTNAFNMFGSYKVIDRSFEAEAAEGMELFVEGLNGSIVVKKHLDKKIIVRSRVRSPLDNADEILEFREGENTAALSINKAISNISVSHEVLLPAIKLKNIRLETTNGRIYVEDSMSEVFNAVTKNSHIELMGVNSDKISVNTKNARIQISYVIGRDIEINTNNSIIDVKHVKAQSIKAITTNGRISVENVQSFGAGPEIAMELKTTNSGIRVNMNDMDSRGYKVRARTTNGGINLLIPEMSYSNTSTQGAGSNFVDAESSGYEGYAEKVSINAETNNGYIEIVK
ncbi:MAG: DUF4097 domain-containing protein [Clostridia bacterium]|nr:DUF4097 domain-containing protein [Clostridia bacterium]